MSKFDICSECKKFRKLYAKGLCNSCYVKPYVLKWKLKNPEKIKENHRKDIQRNGERYREMDRVKALKYRTIAVNILGNKCSNPYNLKHGDFLEFEECLEIDHINNDGNIARTGCGTYYKNLCKEIVRTYPDIRFQVLCSNCNHIKEMRRRRIG